VYFIKRSGVSFSKCFHLIQEASLETVRRKHAIRRVINTLCISGIKLYLAQMTLYPFLFALKHILELNEIVFSSNILISLLGKVTVFLILCTIFIFFLGHLNIYCSRIKGNKTSNYHYIIIPFANIKFPIKHLKGNVLMLQRNM
jgi:hypothetical protein